MESSKKPELGPVLKRDEHNRLDMDHTDAVLKDITKNLISEQRDYQKEIAFKHSRSNKRDLVMKIVLYQRNSVNGKIVVSDNDDPSFESLSADPLHAYKYKYFEHIDAEISVKEMPMSAKTVYKWLMGCCNAALNYIVRMGIIDRV
jgi:hypothetical protein